MIVKVTSPIAVHYPGGGYGSYSISLESGIQTVNDSFGEFLLQKHAGIVVPHDIPSIEEDKEENPVSIPIDLEPSFPEDASNSDRLDKLSKGKLSTN